MKYLVETPWLNDIICPHCAFDFNVKLPGYNKIEGLDPRVEIWGHKQGKARSSYLTTLIHNGVPIKCPNCGQDFVYDMLSGNTYFDNEDNTKTDYLRKMVIKHQSPSFKDYWNMVHTEKGEALQ